MDLQGFPGYTVINNHLNQVFITTKNMRRAT